MIFKGVKYQFSALPWQYQGKGAWMFVSLPMVLTAEIRNLFKTEEEGWGRLKVTAKISNSEWKTAIWFDKKSQTYLLPLKADIRKKENIQVEQSIEVNLWI
jgi:hypothetical protein